jgi:hypothetical protein
MRIPLKIAFVEAGTSQRRVARDAHIAESRLSAIVQGWIEPRDDERAAIAQALNRSVEQLFDDPSSFNQTSRAALQAVP